MKPIHIILLIGAAALLMAGSVVPLPGALPAGLFALINEFEVGGNINNYLTAYRDEGDVWTIGYGSIYNYDKKRYVDDTDKIDVATAKRWYETEAKEKTAQVKAMVKVPINANQLAALVSLAYNIGDTALQDSTLLRLLNSGATKQQVADQFDRWIYVKGKVSNGLIRRRKAEKSLFLTN